jgi:hypothetical protein
MPEPRHNDEDVKSLIQRLIEDEPDARERIRLLILLQLNSTLVDNVVAVRELTKEYKGHREEFEQHVEKDRLMVAYGRGALWAAVILVGVIQVMVGFVLKQHMEEFKHVATISATTAAKLDQHMEENKVTTITLQAVASRLEKHIEKTTP